MQDENNIKHINKVEETETILFSDENYSRSKPKPAQAELVQEEKQAINAASVRKIETAVPPKKQKPGFLSGRKKHKTQKENIDTVETDTDEITADNISATEKVSVEGVKPDQELADAEYTAPASDDVIQEPLNAAVRKVEPEEVFTTSFADQQEGIEEKVNKTSKKRSVSLNKILIPVAAVLALLAIVLAANMLLSNKKGNDDATAAVTPEPTVQTETALPVIEKTAEPTPSEKTEPVETADSEKSEGVPTESTVSSAEPSATPEATPSPTPTATPTPTPAPTETPAPKPSATPTAKPEPTATPSASPAATATPVPTPTVYQVGEGPQGSAGRIYFSNGASTPANWGGANGGLGITRTEGLMTLMTGNPNFTPSVGQTLTWYDEYGYAYTYQCTSIYSTYVQDGIIYISDGNPLNWANYGNMAINSNGTVSYWNII